MTNPLPPLPQVGQSPRCDDVSPPAMRSWEGLWPHSGASVALCFSVAPLKPLPLPHSPSWQPFRAEKDPLVLRSQPALRGMSGRERVSVSSQELGQPRSGLPES